MESEGRTPAQNSENPGRVVAHRHRQTLGKWSWRMLSVSRLVFIGGAVDGDHPVKSMRMTSFSPAVHLCAQRCLRRGVVPPPSSSSVSSFALIVLDVRGGGAQYRGIGRAHVAGVA